MEDSYIIAKTLAKEVIIIKSSWVIKKNSKEIKNGDAIISFYSKDIMAKKKSIPKNKKAAVKVGNLTQGYFKSVVIKVLGKLYFDNYCFHI
jgi:hypothetical protein